MLNKIETGLNADYAPQFYQLWIKIKTATSDEENIV